LSEVEGTRTGRAKLGCLTPPMRPFTMLHSTNAHTTVEERRFSAA